MSLSSLNSIRQTVFELESGNEKCGRTDGCRTHQSNRWVGYTQPTENTFYINIYNVLHIYQLSILTQSYSMPYSLEEIFHTFPTILHGSTKVLQLQLIVTFHVLPLRISKPMHRRTDANLYPPERQLIKISEPSFDLEGGDKGQT